MHAMIGVSYRTCVERYELFATSLAVSLHLRVGTSLSPTKALHLLRQGHLQWQGPLRHTTRPNKGCTCVHGFFYIHTEK